MNTEPNQRVARLLALLDAFADASPRYATLGMHEHSDFPQLAETVAEWCKRNKHDIEHHVTTSHHRTYEVWSIRVGDATINVWPLKLGTLDNKDDLRAKIEAIRAEADKQCIALLEAEQAKAASQLSGVLSHGPGCNARAKEVE